MGEELFLIIPANASWFRIDSIDLTGISRASFSLNWLKPPVSGYTFEVHLDSPTGVKIGEFTFAGVAGKAPESNANARPRGRGNFKLSSAELPSTITPISDGKLHNVFIVSKAKDSSIDGTAIAASLQFFSK